MLDRRQREQIPFALALTVTRLARRVETDLRKDMRAQFDRPTPYTLSSTFATMATKLHPQAEVGIKAEPEGKSRIGPADVLRHQFAGGERARKALEGWLTRAGYISEREFLVPGAKARLDQYGNMSRGQVQQILSQLRAGLDPATYASRSARSRRRVRKAGVLFWSRGGTLPRGVWKREGRTVEPILMVARVTPQYAQRIDLPAIAAAVVKRYQDEEFYTALRQAIRSSGDRTGTTKAQRSASGRELWRRATGG